MTTFQAQFLSELAVGHDGPPIPAGKLAYFQERLRGIFFDFILNKFLQAQSNGLTKAKLARRIGKAPEIVNRLLGAPSNMTIDTMSELLIGIAAEEFVPQSSSLLNRPVVNFSHSDHLAELVKEPEPSRSSSARNAMFSVDGDDEKQSAKSGTGNVVREPRKSALCD